MPTFKVSIEINNHNNIIIILLQIQGQIYHRTGSLLPTSDSDHKFLQIYFIGDLEKQVDQRCAHNNLVKRPILEQLKTFFHH